jgi:3-hydroxyacyl-CoA dehydrogenase
MQTVVVVIGAGQIGQAIARRVAVGKHVVLADRSEANANAAPSCSRNSATSSRAAAPGWSSHLSHVGLWTRAARWRTD